MLVHIVVVTNTRRIAHVQMLTNSSLQGFLAMSRAQQLLLGLLLTSRLKQGLRIKALLSHRFNDTRLQRSQWRRHRHINGRVSTISHRTYLLSCLDCVATVFTYFLHLFEALRLQQDLFSDHAGTVKELIISMLLFHDALLFGLVRGGEI